MCMSMLKLLLLHVVRDVQSEAILQVDRLE